MILKFVDNLCIHRFNNKTKAIVYAAFKFHLKIRESEWITYIIFQIFFPHNQQNTNLSITLDAQNTSTKMNNTSFIIITVYKRAFIYIFKYVIAK